MKRVLGTLATVVLGFLALADAPDQLAKWRRFIGSLVGLLGVDWSAFWSGPAGRWILVLLAVIVGLWAWDVPPKIRSKLSRRTPLRIGDGDREGSPAQNSLDVTEEGYEQSPPRLPAEVVGQRLREYRSRQAETAYRQKIISVNWQPEPKGLHFRVTNTSAEVVNTFKLFLIDLKWWSREQREFVQSRDFHGSGSFPQVELRLEEAKLFHKDETTVPFLHSEAHSLWFVGKAHQIAPLEKQYVRREGIWQVTLRHELDGKPVIHNDVRCFEWKKGAPPRPCDCPEEADL